MKIDTQKGEKVTITYDYVTESLAVLRHCIENGLSIRDSYHIKDEDMRYTGQAVLVADRPLEAK